MALQEAAVTAGDLARFSEVFADLTDPDIMDRAWQ
jgi:hypothetical protein